MQSVDPEIGQVGDLPNVHFFETKQIRHNFIKKVYSLLLVQLAITVGFVTLFTLHSGIHKWAATNSWFQMASFAVAFVILIAITCMDRLRRKHPYNLIVLFLFTIAESLMLATITVMYQTNILMIAGGLTLVICVALTLFAMQTKYDFTTKSGIMLVVLMVAVSVMFIGLLFPPSRIFTLVIGSVMAIIMGIYLVIDTQMIVGGTHSIQMSPEEYVFAAINLYLDIINMFLYILMILGRE